MKSSKKLAPIHAGALLQQFFLEPLEMTAYGLAKAINVHPQGVYDLVKGKRALTAEIAVRLGHYFGADPQYFMNMQTRYELERIETEKGAQIRKNIRSRFPTKNGSRAVRAS